MTLRTSIRLGVVAAMLVSVAATTLGCNDIRTERSIAPTAAQKADSALIENALNGVDCKRLYKYPDQAYAYAAMVGATCLTEDQSVRVRAYATAADAERGLADELAVLPPGAVVLRGDTWFVMLPSALSDSVSDRFSDLVLLESNELRRLVENAPESDGRDMCVTGMTSILDLYAAGQADQADVLAAQYAEHFPTATEAALDTAKMMLEDTANAEVINNRDIDPFAFDVLLATLVSPLKQHCAGFEHVR